MQTTSCSMVRLTAVFALGEKRKLFGLGGGRQQAGVRTQALNCWLNALVEGVLNRRLRSCVCMCVIRHLCVCALPVTTHIHTK